MRRRCWSYLCLLLGVVLVLGCTVTKVPILPDGPLSWQEGYRDGYNSLLVLRVRDAKTATTQQPLTYRKDLPRFEADAEYRDGWQMGYAAADAVLIRAEQDRRQQELLIGILLW